MHTSIIYVTKKVIHWGANHPTLQNPLHNPELSNCNLTKIVNVNAAEIVNKNCSLKLSSFSREKIFVRTKNV